MNRPSPGWRIFFRATYRLLRLLDPLLISAWRTVPFVLPRSVLLYVPGRRTGTSRSTLLTLLTVGRHGYVGHPNGMADWAANLEAAGEGVLVFPDRREKRVRAIRLWAGPEREKVIRATWSQQPFPAAVAYALARSHVRAVGVFFRLVDGE